MKVEQLKIINFRGFKGERILEFKQNINVFVGINGSGKTSILDIIASLLGAFTSKLSISNDFRLTNLDINIDEDDAHSYIIVSHISPIANVNGNQVAWGLSSSFHNTELEFFTADIYLQEYINSFLKNPNRSIPIFKYFRAQRNSSEKDNPIPSPKRYIAEQFKAYEGAFDKNLDFDDFFTWFVEEENKENRAKVSLKNLNHTSPKLDAIRNSIQFFLKSFPTFNYENLRVEERLFNQKTNEKSSLVIDKNGKTFNLKQLSDGEKMLILMVADVAHRLAIANPSLDNPLLGDGIVLIDEIDLHLHPAWQREVIPCLVKTFPNIQFFATSHSPQVLSSIEAENIFIIDDFEFIKYTPNTLGKDSNSILWDIFGVPERPIKSKEKIEDFYTLLSESEQEKAKKLLEELTEQLGSNDPEIVKAKLHLEFQTDSK